MRVCQIGAAEVQAVNVKSFLKIVKKYTEPTELTPQLLHEFVEKIVVHEADKSSGHRVQRIDVHYILDVLCPGSKMSIPAKLAVERLRLTFRPVFLVNGI